MKPHELELTLPLACGPRLQGGRKRSLSATVPPRPLSLWPSQCRGSTGVFTLLVPQRVNFKAPGERKQLCLVENISIRAWEAQPWSHDSLGLWCIPQKRMRGPRCRELTPLPAPADAHRQVLWGCRRASPAWEVGAETLTRELCPAAPCTQVAAPPRCSHQEPTGGHPMSLCIWGAGPPPDTGGICRGGTMKEETLEHGSGAFLSRPLPVRHALRQVGGQCRLCAVTLVRWLKRRAMAQPQFQPRPLLVSLPPRPAPAVCRLHPPVGSPPRAGPAHHQGEQFPVFLPPASFIPRGSSQTSGALEGESRKYGGTKGAPGPSTSRHQPGAPDLITWLGSRLQPPHPHKIWGQSGTEGPLTPGRDISLPGSHQYSYSAP